MICRALTALWFGALLLVVWCVPMRAQTAAGRLIVDVVDTGTQLVPGATISVMRDGQPPRTAVADGAGQAQFPALPAGTYSVTASLQGFQDAVAVTARVRNGADARVTLRLGAPTFDEVVTVGAASSTPPPETSVAKDELLQLPPDPDVLQSTIDALGGFGSTVRVDGLTSGGLPPASTIQQIRIRQNSYDAEFHDATPAFVEIITSSKPMPWQLVLGVSDRAEALQARNAFNPDAPSAQAEYVYVNANGNLANRASVVFFGNYNGQTEDQPLVAQTPSGPVRGLVHNPSHYAFSTLRIGLDDWHRQTLRIEGDYQDQGMNNVGAGGFNLPERAYDRDVTTARLRGFWTEPLANGASQVLRLQLQHQLETDTPASAAPALVVLNAFSSGGAQFGGARATNQLELTDVLTKPVGQHQVWRAGLLLWHGDYDSSIVSNAGGTLTFSSLDSYVAGQPASYTQRVGSAICCFGVTQLGIWAQDDIAVSKTVNLAVGLRQESESVIGGAVHLAPRAQMDWSPAAHKRTTLRLGVGVFYSWLNPSDFEQTVRVDGVHQHDVLIVDPPFPDASGGTTSALPPSGRYLLGPDLTLPRTVRSSVGIDEAVGALLLHADYAHATGTHLFRGDNLNAPNEAGLRPDPTFANVIAVTSTGEARSDTLSASATYSDPKHGRFLRVNYTFAHAYNNTDGAFFVPVDEAHPEAEWGPSSQDVHHRISGNVSDIVGPHLSLGSYWNFSSAPPYTITTGLDPNGDGIFNERPSGVGRNSARGFSQFDQGVFLGWQWPRYTFALDKPPRRRVQLALSASNVWNRVNRTVISGVLSSPFFGQAVSAAPPRRVYIGINTIF